MVQSKERIRTTRSKVSSIVRKGSGLQGPKYGSEEGKDQNNEVQSKETKRYNEVQSKERIRRVGRTCAKSDRMDGGCC
jgi:hypothetical protein